MSKYLTAEPVIHEFAAFLKVPDLDLYYSIISYFSNVSDRHNHFITDRQGRNFKMWSKAGGFINPKNDKPAFEYPLKWQDAFGASTCYLNFKPMFGKGTKTKTGKTNNIGFKGVSIEVKTSYFELHQILDIIEDILKEFDALRFFNMIDRKESKIIDMALHVRYHEIYEGEVVNMLLAIDDASTARGDTDLTKRARGGKYDMCKVDLPSFDVCNITTNYILSIKSYRILNFLKRDPSDPLKHPKLEAYLNYHEYKSSKNEYPSLSEYLDIKRDLADLLAKLLSFVQPIDYVPDEYFTGKTYEYRYDLPQWNYKKPAEKVQFDINEDKSKSHAALRILAFLAFQREGTAEFPDILENTGIPERTAWRYINQFAERGILETERKRKTIVSFTKKSLFRNMKEHLIALSNYLDFGYKSLYGHVFKDTGQIRNYHDRDKNLVHIQQHDFSVLHVDSSKKATYLNKNLKKLGVKRIIGVPSGN